MLYPINLSEETRPIAQRFKLYRNGSGKVQNQHQYQAEPGKKIL